MISYPRVLFSAALLLLASPLAHAAQDGLVTTMTAEVHQFPNASSPQLGTINKGAKVRLSSDVVRDVRGEYWYKTKLPSGEAGYIRAADVKGNQLDRELKDAGVSRPATAVEDVDAGELPWSFVVRGMGLLGIATPGSQFDVGGEAEFSFSVFLRAHGYLHRMLSVGPAVQVFSANEVAALGSVIYRVFTHTRAEPEFRLRFGEGLTSKQFLLGANFGVRYPFSLDSGPHLAGYLEAGGLASVSSTPIGAHFFASAGLGYHF